MAVKSYSHHFENKGTVVPLSLTASKATPCCLCNNKIKKGQRHVQLEWHHFRLNMHHDCLDLLNAAIKTDDGVQDNSRTMLKASKEQRKEDQKKSQAAKRQKHALIFRPVLSKLAEDGIKPTKNRLSGVVFSDGGVFLWLYHDQVILRDDRGNQGQTFHPSDPDFTNKVVAAVKAALSS